VGLDRTTSSLLERSGPRPILGLMPAFFWAGITTARRGSGMDSSSTSSSRAARPPPPFRRGCPPRSSGQHDHSGRLRTLTGRCRPPEPHLAATNPCPPGDGMLGDLSDERADTAEADRADTGEPASSLHRHVTALAAAARNRRGSPTQLSAARATSPTSSARPAGRLAPKSSPSRPGSVSPALVSRRPTCGPGPQRVPDGFGDSQEPPAKTKLGHERACPPGAPRGRTVAHPDHSMQHDQCPGTRPSSRRHAFAMRRSGVRIPSAPPNTNPVPPARALPRVHSFQAGRGPRPRRRRDRSHGRSLPVPGRAAGQTQLGNHMCIRQ